MTFVEWSKSNADYGLKLMNSAVEGARSGEDEFVREVPLTPYLAESARQALGPALVGACVGILGGSLGNGRRSAARVLASGLLGGAIGFGLGMIWDTREFTVRVASGAWQNVRKTRDDHWFEQHPIDYA